MAKKYGSLGIPAQRPLFSGRGIPAKGRISAQIERNSLENVFQIENPIASALQHLDSVIEPLHKATGVPIAKIIGDPVHMLRQELEKPIEAGYSTFLDGGDPVLQVCDRFRLCVGRFEYGC